MCIEKKVILTETELRKILTKTYRHAFKYSDEYAEHWKKYHSSQGKDCCSYVDNIIFEVLKEA